MPAEFDLYMKSKDIYTAKNGEAQQYYVFYMELKNRIPAIVGLLGGKALTPENVKAIVPKDGLEANYVSILDNMTKDGDLCR